MNEWFTEKPNMCSDGQWRAIKYFQRQLGWDDDHLKNYALKITKLESEKFLDVPTTRKVIAGMKRTLDGKK